MVVSADTLRLAIVPETVPGTTPNNPAWQVVRTTGEGLTYNPTSTFSNEMDASRGVRDSILGGGEVTGDINFELSYNTTFLTLLEGAMCFNWGDLPSGVVAASTPLTGFGEPPYTTTRNAGANDLFVGPEMKTFTVEKRFTLDDGSFAFHRYNGCIVNTMSLNVTPNEPISGTFGMLGRGMILATTELAGATYTDPGVNPVFTARTVGDFFINGPSFDMTFDAYCFNSVTYNLNNNARRISCIGPEQFAATVLGRCEVTIDMNIYFADNKLLTYLQDQVEVQIRSILEDTAAPQHKFVLNSDRCKMQTGSVVASGTGQDIIANSTWAALIPAVRAGNTGTVGPLIISRETI